MQRRPQRTALPESRPHFDQGVAEALDPLVAEPRERHSVREEHQITATALAVLGAAIFPSGAQRPQCAERRAARERTWRTACRVRAGLPTVVPCPFRKEPANPDQRPYCNAIDAPARDREGRLDRRERRHQVRRARTLSAARLCVASLRACGAHELGSVAPRFSRRKRAGTPAQIWLAGTLRVTTEFT